MPQFTVDEVSKFVQDKHSLYEAVQRNGYYLPSSKSTVCTEQYLTKVLSGKVFCPKYEQIKLKPCPRPPYKQVLFEKFMAFMRHKKLDPGFEGDRQPDVKWLLTVLSTVTPDDDIFKKSYVPPARESKLSQIEAIELPASFLKDLPETKRKVKRRALQMIGEGLQKQKL
jgi:hypothetical protein